MNTYKQYDKQRYIHVCSAHPILWKNNIMEIVKKSRFLSSLEKYNIYCTWRHNKHVNETSTDNNDPIFDRVYNHFINSSTRPFLNHHHHTPNTH
jgi:hypothetical protein